MLQGIDNFQVNQYSSYNRIQTELNRDEQLRKLGEQSQAPVEEKIEEAPREYTSGGSATTGLADLLKNIKL